MTARNEQGLRAKTETCHALCFKSFAFILSNQSQNTPVQSNVYEYSKLGKTWWPISEEEILRSLYTFNFVPWSFSTSLVVLTRQGIVQPSQSLTLVVFEVSPVANVSSLNNFICMWKFLVVGCDAKPKIRPCTKHLLSFGRADDEVVAILLCLGQVLRFTEGRGLVLELEAHRM